LQPALISALIDLKSATRAKEILSSESEDVLYAVLLTHLVVFRPNR